ncbi:MAG: ATP-binding cassette domain-containing protein [Acidobacteria bacterium]|nr:ATP-binding cassette domain-containing protein [Acidobacteriota bacterium]
MTFSVPEGHIFALLGPNGAGKATTLRILTMLIRATGGTAEVGGVDVRRDPLGVRKRIVRGLSISAEGNASRIRDHISLRSRGATADEILLRLRELQSGYEYDFSMSLTIPSARSSAASSIHNPRFGQ